MKKIVLLCMAIILSTILVACDLEDKDHVHSYHDFVTIVEPSCTVGIEKGTCECGATLERQIYATRSHYYIWSIVTEATCTENGLEQGVCACGKTTTKTVFSHHTASEWIIDIPATETEEGKCHKECTVCGEIIEKDIIYAKGSIGLSYTINSNYKTCTITGIGSCTASHVVIPSSIDGYPVTAIASNAFKDCTSFTNITIPDIVKSIGDYAFYKCKSLTSIIIPDSVTSISNHAFLYCTSLTSITIPDSVKSIGDSAFEYCTSLTSITIPDSVKSIGDSAFKDCTSLTNVTIPNSITSIDDWTFSFCTSLKSVTIPDSVKSIGEDAFSCCFSLTNVYYTGDVDDWLGICFGNVFSNPMYDDGAHLYFNGELVTSITIPDSVTSIPDWVFSGCTSLTSITIPDSVKSIGDGAFRNCTSLANVYYTGEIEGWLDIHFSNVYSNPMYDGANLYFNNNIVTEIEIPDSVNSITAYAFAGCTPLTSIKIPDSVTSIGRYAFYNCESLTSIEIGDSVTSIGDYVFMNCKSLTSITIPDSVTSIGDGAFKDCTSLTSITIPDSVMSMGENAFYGCSNLKINCIVESQPSGWNTDWNKLNYSKTVPVVWDYKGEQIS